MKKLLVVIDMQNDFINGTLGTSEAQKIVPNVQKKIDEYKKQNWMVVFTKDSHAKDYLSTQEGKKLPVEHCIIGTEGWQISSQLTVGESMVFEKNGFGSTELGKFVVENDFNDVLFVGLCTDICVICNCMLIKAFNPETKVSVDASCCAGVTPESHKNALSAMKMCQIEIING